MVKKRRDIDCPREPIGLRREEAAAFLSISPSLFDRLVAEGVLPCPHRLASVRVWDADELIRALRRAPRDYAMLHPGFAPFDDDGGAPNPYRDFKL